MPFFKLKSKRDSKEDTNPQKPEGHGIVRETLEPGERHHVRANMDPFLPLYSLPLSMLLPLSVGLMFRDDV